MVNSDWSLPSMGTGVIDDVLAFVFTVNGCVSERSAVAATEREWGESEVLKLENDKTNLGGGNTRHRSIGQFSRLGRW